MCCDEWDFKEEINREYPDCETPTVDGIAYNGCNYSPTICQTCGDSPCDQSC